MKIMNIMLGKGLGGIEQVFLDYTMMLRERGHEVISVYHPKSALAQNIAGTKKSLSHFSQFDPFAIYRLKDYLKKDKPDCVITHGNRAGTLFRKTRLKVPHFAVCHNYKIKPLIGSDTLITITEDIRKHAIQLGQGEGRAFIIPNMMKLPQNFKTKNKQTRTPPIIGFMGRFVAKKGVPLFLEALMILKKEGFLFKALIAGDGPEKENILAQIKSSGLDHDISLLGWVQDKEEFFDQIDLFCLPSHEEPFGLVLLEAMSFGTPVVATAASGPLEIAEHEKDVLFSPLGSAQTLAENIKRLLHDPALKARLVEGGYETVQRYTPELIGQALDALLTRTLGVGEGSNLTSKVE